MKLILLKVLGFPILGYQALIAVALWIMCSKCFSVMRTPSHLGRALINPWAILQSVVGKFTTWTRSELILTYISFSGIEKQGTGNCYVSTFRISSNFADGRIAAFVFWRLLLDNPERSLFHVALPLNLSFPAGSMSKYIKFYISNPKI
jgi:hypothetical protein